jgi:hypothetical protein
MRCVEILKKRVEQKDKSAEAFAAAAAAADPSSSLRIQAERTHGQTER